MKTRAILLYVVAAAFFVYEQVAFAQWIKQFGTVMNGLAHAWGALQSNPMLFLAWNDMGIFTVIVLVWLWRDLRAHGRSLLWWPATLVFGSPAVLVYLARNPDALRPTVEAR